MNRFIYRPGRTQPVYAPSVEGLGGIMEPHNPMLPPTAYPVTEAYYDSPYQSSNYQPAQAPIESPIMAANLLTPTEAIHHHPNYGIAYTPTALSGGAQDAASFLSFANLFLR
jgi:hypothetical protein